MRLSSKISKHRHISKVRLNKKAKHIKTQRKKTNRKTRIFQRGGFDYEINIYYDALDKQVNTYDIKLMLIYTYLMNPALTKDDKLFIDECMKIESFGRFYGVITIDDKTFNIGEILEVISKLLRLTITGVISIGQEGRPENRDWHLWLDMKARNGLPLPSFLLKKIDIDNIKGIFLTNGIIKPLQTLDFLKNPYVMTDYGMVNITSGDPIFAAPPRRPTALDAAAPPRRPTALDAAALAAEASARRPTALDAAAPRAAATAPRAAATAPRAAEPAPRAAATAPRAAATAPRAAEPAPRAAATAPRAAAPRAAATAPRAAATAPRAAEPAPRAAAASPRAAAPANELTHFWFKLWPDHGVPKRSNEPNGPDGLQLYCNFIKEIYNHIVNFGGDSIIHCSAGVGRTGVVYITLNLLFKFGIDPNYQFPLPEFPYGITKAIIKEEIMSSREYRMKLVQTIDQYNFIVKCFGASKTNDHPVYKDRDIEEEKQSKYSTTFSKQNPSKNRYGNILTYDDMSNGVPRVKTLIIENNPNGYINASFAPRTTPDKGIRPDWNCPKFILSQCPKDNTIIDFQNMIRLHNIRRIIMVTGLVEQGRSKCDDYLALNSEDVPFIVNEFTLYESTQLAYGKFAYGQQQEYTYTPLDSRPRVSSTSSA